LYFADFVVDNEVIIEIKVATRFQKGDFMQLLSYLKATNKKLGILAVFTPKGVRFKRIVN
jgi:GxxExxY protein